MYATLRRSASDPSFSLLKVGNMTYLWTLMSQVPYYKTTQIHRPSGKRLRNITMENHHFQWVNPL